jgi:ankyrin repeat protein
MERKADMTRITQDAVHRNLLRVLQEDGAQEALQELFSGPDGDVARAVINRFEEDGEGTALQRAVKNERPVEVLKLLVDAGADVNCLSRSEDDLPLRTVEEAKHDGLGEINPGCISFTATCMVSPLHLAAELDRLDLVDFLIEQGASVNITDYHGATPLHSAAYGEAVEIVRRLIGAKALVNAVDRYNRTPLHMPDLLPEIVDLLLDAGADPNARDTQGWTQLHRIFWSEHSKSALKLLEKGANPFDKTAKGETAFDVGLQFRDRFGSHCDHEPALVAMLDWVVARAQSARPR